jgi:hypothetical protein
VLNRLKDTCDFIAPSLEDESGDGRMVTDLLPIGRTAVDPALESFAQNGIEGLLHAEIHD